MDADGGEDFVRFGFSCRVNVSFFGFFYNLRSYPSICG